MSALRKELVLLVLQFLNEENFKETAHRLEQESGYFFNMKYFEDVVTNGELDEAEKYLSGFTKFDDNRYSTKIFFEMRKQKYLEALDRRDDAKAAEILRNDLKAFSTYDEELFKEMTMLLSLNNFREIEQLSKYVDSKSARVIMLAEIKRLVEANPLFRDKLQLPASINSRLRALINQSLNWQHQICNYSNPNPEIKTLLADHTCGTSNGAPAPPSVMNPLLSCTPRIGGVSALAPAPAALMAPLAGWGANPSMTMQPTVSGCPIAIPARKPAAPMRKRFRTPPYSPAADDECIIKRSRPIEISDEVNHQAVLHSSDDLPKTVVCNLNQGSAVNSMDFHPVQQTLLLIGTNAGEIRIWEIVSREMLYLQGFKVWDLGARSLDLQASLASEYTASVNRVVWSPDGDLFGVAYSKHIVQIYSYHGGNIQHHLEMDAHVGNVSDIAFSQLKEQLYFVTCGRDRTVKVWSATTGSRQYTFEGHESPVYSVCPHQRNNVQFIFSATVNGRIKVWLYDNMGPRLDIDAPGRSCTKMLYSADGTRVFSCGTNREGESYLVEWIESEGAIKRTYHGLGKCPVGVVHFDTARNRFLAAGDEFLIKIWAMDNDNVLTTIDAEGGLPVSPCVKFNREGLLLAVSTSENAVKVLASDKVLHLLHSNGSRALDAPKVFSGITAKGPTTGSLGASSSTGGTSIPPSGRNSPAPSIFGLNSDTEHFSDVKTRTNGELENSQAWNLKEYDEQSQFQSLRLPDRLLPTRIIRMIYTSSGGAILALTDNAVHKFWRWRQNEFNPSGKATCAVEPKLWQPSSGIIMTNDISNIVLDDANPCFALSKNDSYLLSTSGGKISLFNMMTFKTMTTFMPPPPAATCLEFHPRDNNMVAIGMEDSSIQIFNVRVNEVESKFKGHQKRVTGLAFSDILNVLVSSGADAQLCVWSTDKWENLASKFLPIPTHRMSSTLAKTRVLFHQDRRHFLVVHETQIAIYEAPKLDCHKQWYPLESDAPITDAAYSCDGMSIYTSFEEGSVGIFTASTLQLKCRISAAAYLPSNSSSRVFPVVVAAHPSEPTQFALGLSNGGVIVLEPPELERKWGTDPPVPNGSGPARLQF